MPEMQNHQPADDHIPKRGLCNHPKAKRSASAKKDLVSRLSKGLNEGFLHMPTGSCVQTKEKKHTARRSDKGRETPVEFNIGGVGYGL